jgi:SAM-dependent methyltransferase
MNAVSRRYRDLIAVTWRLSQRRRERFFLAAADEPKLWHRYDEFFVYNWHRPIPERHAILVDVGRPQPHFGQLELEISARMRAGSGNELPLVGFSELSRFAMSESRARLEGQVETLVREQVYAHEYLGSIGTNSPLLPDVLQLLGALPERLGDVVEVGSGHGRLARELSDRASRYLCVDLVGQRTRDDPANRLVVAGDAHHLPLSSDSVDTVIANNALEHLYDPTRALNEIARVLRPGGSLFALIPLDALNPRHEGRAHLWKTDQLGITWALSRTSLELVELRILDLYELGVPGCFPACCGLVGLVSARNR